MLQIKSGNLFNHAVGQCIIAHGANARGKMNKGFAKELRQRYPAAYLCYLNEHRENELTLGEVIIRVCGEAPNDVHICHCITQKDYGTNPSVVYVSYDAVEKSLSRVVSYSKTTGLPIHLPVIGGGNANGDREKLLSIFRGVFDSVSATVWELNDGNNTRTDRGNSRLQYGFSA